jgi:hypothetical protein
VGGGGSARRKVRTEEHSTTRTSIHASSGIRTHNPSDPRPYTEAISGTELKFPLVEMRSLVIILQEVTLKTKA